MFKDLDEKIESILTGDYTPDTRGYLLLNNEEFLEAMKELEGRCKS